jgi:hypothetical protein
MVGSYDIHTHIIPNRAGWLAMTPWLTSWVPKLFNLSKLRGRSLASLRDAREGFMEASMAPLVHVAVAVGFCTFPFWKYSGLVFTVCITAYAILKRTA